MNTSKPFSTISYNSIPFLNTILKRKVEHEEIGFYAFVYHYAEDDDLDADKLKKDHIHLYIEPEKRLDTISFMRDFHEVTSDNEKPLGIVKCKSSKFQEWYLYCCHDIKYLGAKGLDRQYHYNFDDFVSNDYVYFNELIKSMDLSKYTCLERFLNAVKNDLTFSQCVSQGLVPIQLIGQYEKCYNLLDNIDKKREREIDREYERQVQARNRIYNLRHGFVEDNSDLSFPGESGGSKGGV